ncbi:MAG TPA: branched-chain amino acid ABC transporter permease [Deinococcales bacterium]|nr:branched-chain amino acid ABC transporter permease [Deinococcales bacterium]
MALQLLPSTLTDGLVLGFVYAVIALGYTMVYGVLELINFAHSEIFMTGGVVGILVLSAIVTSSTPAPLAAILIALVVGFLAAGLLAVGVERVAYRPLRLRGAPRLVPLISAIGMSFFLQDAVRFFLSLAGRFYVTPPSFPALNQRVNMGPVSIQVKSIVVIVVAALMMLALSYLVNRTRVGKAIRAVAQDRGTAGLMGINVDSIIVMTFLIGGGLGGMAGVLFGLQYNQLDPYSGFLPGLKAFTAAVLGGIGNIPGAMVGGIVLGVIEVIAGTYLPIWTNGAMGTEYKDIVAFAVLIVILIFKPAGLLGKAVTEKV